MGAKLDRWLQRQLAKAEAKTEKTRRLFRPTPMTFAEAVSYAESIGMAVPPLEREIDGALCSMATFNEMWTQHVGAMHALSGHLRALKADPTVLPFDKAKPLTSESAEKVEEHLLRWLLDERENAWSEATFGLEASSTTEGAITASQTSARGSLRTSSPKSSGVRLWRRCARLRPPATRRGAGLRKRCRSRCGS